MTPTVGRIVHYYTRITSQHANGVGEGPYVAVISQVFEQLTFSNLKVLPPFAAPYDQGSVKEKAYAVEGLDMCYWTWPPRD